MKKILGIIGSQRKLANGEILVKEAAAASGVEHELELIRLPDLKLETCRGCYTCLTPGKLCPLKDDLYFLADKIKEADGIILSAPCYALGPSAAVKLWADRVLALAQLADDFWGKPSVVIGTAGIEGWEGYTLSGLVQLSRLLGLDVKDANMFVGALPGEVLEQEENIKRVRQMGQALFGQGRTHRQGECPTCWSEIWKFPEPNRAVCPFCGQEAHLVFGPDGILWKMDKPGNRFEYENHKYHFREWLPGKVAEYIKRRKELAVLRDRYNGEYTWVLPIRDSKDA
ncbi:hypothetical protein JCM15765_40750 [Paradesulfitobacterium aromaticivorans]